MPRSASADMSPKGSMNTTAAGGVRRKIAWPDQSTRIRTLLLGVAAAHPRCGGGDETGGDREREGRMEPGLKRAGDELREERAAGHGRLCGGRKGGERMRPHEVPDRVVAEERCEQDRHRR